MDLPPQLWCAVLRHLGSNDAACLAAAADPLSDLVCHALARRLGLGDWLLEAAEDARPEACRWLADHAPLPLPDPGQAFAAAATRGRLAVCQFLAAHSGLDTAHLPEWVEGAARGGHTRACQWLVGSLSDTDREQLLQAHGASFLCAAAQGGAAAACMWLVGAAPLTRQDGAHALPCAIRGGHLDVCVSLKDHFQLTPADMTLVSDWVGYGKALRKAAAGGHLHVWRWLEEHMGLRLEDSHPLVCARVVRAAGEHGHLDMVRHLVEGPEGELLIQWELLWPMMHAAAANGRFDVCRWALERHVDPQKSLAEYRQLLFEGACRHGSAAECEWLARHLQVTSCRPQALRAAAAEGHLEVCQSLASHFRLQPGAFGDALFDAAGRGHLRVCRWLVLSGLVVLDKWTWRRALWAAIGGGHLAVFRLVARRVSKTNQ